MTDYKEDIEINARELLIQLPNLSNRELREKYLSQQQYIDILMVTMGLLEDINLAIHIAINSLGKIITAFSEKITATQINLIRNELTLAVKDEYWKVREQAEIVLEKLNSVSQN